MLCLCTGLSVCALWSPAGGGWGDGLLALTCEFVTSHWYPGSGVVLDCIDS